MKTSRSAWTTDSVLELYRLAQSKNVAEFPIAAIGWLQKFVDFDMALLGLLSREPDGKIVTHFGKLVNESAPVLDEWVSIIDKDKVVLRMVDNVGHAMSYCVPEHFKAAPQLLDFAIRSRHMNVLAAAHAFGPNQLMSGLSLRRAEARWTFSSDESRTLEALLPHLTEAFKVNRSIFSALAVGLRSIQKTGICICDEHGYFLYKDEFFDELVTLRENGGAPHKLPVDLIAAMAIPGKNSVISNERGLSFSFIENGRLRVVSVHELTLVDKLTPRELSVAELYAQGLTHKEIGPCLAISPATARRHIEAVYAKLQIRTKAELASRLEVNALRGLLDLSRGMESSSASAPASH